MHYKGRPACLFRKLQSYVDLVSGTEYSAVEQGAANRESVPRSPEIHAHTQDLNMTERQQGRRKFLINGIWKTDSHNIKLDSLSHIKYKGSRGNKL